MGGCPTLTPLADKSITGANGLGNLLVAPLAMLMGEKHNPCADCQGLSGGMCADQPVKLLCLCVC
jgi:hypothetical protein